VLGGGQAALREALSENTLKCNRGRAILATFHHGLRCEEVCGLWVHDLQSRQGVPHRRVLGKNLTVHHVSAYPLAFERIDDHLQAAGVSDDSDRPPLAAPKNPAGQGHADRPLAHTANHYRALRRHAKTARMDSASVGPQALRI
jgi:hypothetical protein